MKKIVLPFLAVFALVSCSSNNHNSRSLASLKSEDCKITHVGVAGGTHEHLLAIKKILSEKGYDVSGLKPDMEYGVEWSKTNETSIEYGEGEDLEGPYGRRGMKGVIVQIDQSYRFRTMQIQQGLGPGPQTIGDKLLDAWYYAQLLREERKDIKQAKARAKKEGVSYEFTKIWKWKDGRFEDLEKTFDGHREVKSGDLYDVLKDYPVCKQ